MRHQIKGRKLNKTGSHKRAMFSNMSASLIEHEQIVTTVAKAKELRPFLEKLVTRAKNASVHDRRIILSKIRDEAAVSKLIDVIAPRYANRPGGYIRILKAGYRYGDCAPRALIEFVDRDVSAKGKVDRERLAKEDEETEE